ncbi:BrnT family toxin [Rhodopila sp.]|uniref:BrnT family toxin n=1 Tax=Rhodopila sp. TaxID=2480087 RepID=UPI003D0CA822
MAYTIMRITFDPVKNARNIAERGLPFDLVADLEWETAVAREDIRRDYGERRMRVMGFLGARLHMAVVTYRNDAVHVISLRRANEKEVRWYDEARR